MRLNRQFNIVPRTKSRLKAKSVHKGAILKAPCKELSVRENLFVSLVFTVASRIRT